MCSTVFVGQMPALQGTRLYTGMVRSGLLPALPLLEEIAPDVIHGEVRARGQTYAFLLSDGR